MRGRLLLAAELAAAAVPARAARPFPSVRADMRVELFGCVRLLARDERVGAGFYRHDTPYEAELERRLGPLAAHPVVARWRALERAGADYVSAYQWILTLGDPPALLPREPAPSGLLRAAGGPEGLEEFRLLLADFARAADFSRVYRETAPLRAPVLDDARRQAARDGIGRDLERYWGAPFPVGYDLVVSEFVEPAIAVTRRDDGPDGPRLTSLTGPEDYEGRVTVRLDTRRGTLWALAVEEALRGASSRLSARVARSSALLAQTGPGCAPTWEACSRKEAGFAVATRLLALVGDEASAREFPVKFARIGMPHLAPLASRLGEYERGRRRWPSLPAFYPRLLDEFDALAALGPARPAFAGGLAEALADPSPCALILPAAPSPALSAAVARFRRERRLCDEELTGAQALARRLKGLAVIAVGAPSQNSWLRERWADLQLPVHLEPGALAFDPRPDEASGTAYAGPLGLVSAARNPDDPARPVLLFTAQDPALVPPLLSAFTPAADYEILEGTATVKTGRYEKTRLPWRTK